MTPITQCEAANNGGHHYWDQHVEAQLRAVLAAISNAGMVLVPADSPDAYDLDCEVPLELQGPGVPDGLRRAAQAFVSHMDGPEPKHGLWTILKADREAMRAALREQEPGEATCPFCDGQPMSPDCGVCGGAGTLPIANLDVLREQEPGETLRAADLRRALRANRHAPGIDRDPMANQWNRGIDRALEIVDRLALEADRNPQETER